MDLPVANRRILSHCAFGQGNSASGPDRQSNQGDTGKEGDWRFAIVSSVRSNTLSIVQPSSPVPASELRKTALEQLVALIINQDHVAQGFLKFLISLQGGLAIALSYFFTLPLRAPEAAGAQPRILLAIVLIAFFGAASTIALTAMVIHERKWQAWYIQCANKLGNEVPKLFPAENLGSRDIHSQKIDPIGRVICLMSGAMVIFWIVIAIFSSRFHELYPVREGGRPAYVAGHGIVCCTKPDSQDRDLRGQ